MAHTYTCLLYHVVFSTKERRKQISEDILGLHGRNRPHKQFQSSMLSRRGRLLSCFAVITTYDHRRQGGPTDQGRIIEMDSRGGWTKFFVWQESSGANTIGVSQIPNTIRYIQNQPEYHRRHTYDEELASIIKRHSLR